MFATFAAWQNSLHCPFVFDDIGTVVENTSIRQFWPITRVLAPQNDGSGVGGRPLINLSLAVNYAISGDKVWSYHGLNLLIHAAASLALFGLVRHTLLLPILSQRFGAASLLIGSLVASLWALHPLQTESVTAVSQRTESLMGLCYLLTFYGFVRGIEPGGTRVWLIASMAICLLGMAAKEVMVTAPLLMLLYDRTFVAGSFREALIRRWRYYLGFGGTWLLLAFLVISMGGARGKAAGFGLGVTISEYALTQCRAIVLYVRLAIWPHPLVFDYGTGFVRRIAEVWTQAVVLLSFLGVTVVAVWRRPSLAFLGVWFFAILAPSSSVIPLASQTIAEHRMYLPVASIIVFAVIGGWTFLGRRAACAGFAAAAAFGLITALRNIDYQEELSLWRDTVAKCPENPRAHNNLALLFADKPGGQDAARNHYDTALQLEPNYSDAHFNLGNLLSGQPGRQSEAIAQFEACLRVDSENVKAHNNLGMLLFAQPTRLAEAIAHLEVAVRIKPDLFEAQNNLAAVLASQPGRELEALGHYEAALRLKPDRGELHNNMATLLARHLGRPVEAFRHYEEALRLLPDNALIHLNYARELQKMPNLTDQAVVHLKTALRLDPNLAAAREALLQLQPGER